jgi:glyoxylase-like metal-dependent hydrolase (beta-lactamase superfamily II)
MMHLDEAELEAGAVGWLAMKRGLLACTFMTLVGVAFLNTGSGQSSRVHQLAPGVYYREADPAKHIIANTGWVVFRDYVLVIDANYPWGAKDILPEIRATTNKPIRYVFDTHYHADHLFGDSVWVDAGATILCSEECTEESKRKNVTAWANDKGTGDTSLKPYRLEHPQQSFRGRMVIDDGEHRVELTRIGPGHTLGDAVAYLPKERILFTGDMCVNSPQNNIADTDANPDGWLRALDNLALKDVAILVPGHGALGTTATIKAQRTFIAAIINGVRDAIGKNVPEAELEKSLDLTGYTPYGTDVPHNKACIRAVYAKLSK